MRHSWLIVPVLAFSFLPVRSEGVKPEDNLRYYGRVATSFSASGGEFACESAEKAGLLQGKLLADLFWDAGAAVARKTLVIQGHETTVHVWPPYGAVWVGRVANHVLVRAADGEEELASLLAREPALGAASVQPDKPYPRALDYYDLRAVKFYTHAMATVRGKGVESHWPFVQKFGLGGISFENVAFCKWNPAPGVIDWSTPDYEVNAAERAGGMLTPALNVSAPTPLWVYNRFPDSMMIPDSKIVFGAWGQAGQAGDHYASWGMPQAQRDQTSGLFLQEMLKRYKDSPAIGGWHIDAGAPGAEMGMHDRSTQYWDHSPAGQEWFRQWLRDIRKISLPDLGTRWYGDAGHFKGWDEVQVPEETSFYGDLQAGALLLQDDWRWMAGSAAQEPPEADDPRWVPFRMPPAQDQNFLTWGSSWYRTRFHPDAWRESHAAQEIYLVCGVDVRGRFPARVWLNGSYLGEFAHDGGGTNPFCIKVKALLRPGDNDLVMLIPAGPGGRGEGKIYGPVALTATPPRIYPYYGRNGNAQFLDLRAWQAYGIYHDHLLAVQKVRSLDPDRPLILSPGSSVGISDYAAELCSTYGMGMQDTGREATDRPWWPRLGYLNGYYGTSESSATPAGKSMDRLRSWLLVDGDSSFDFFWNIEDFMQREDQDGWFTRNQRLLRLVGKALPEKPSIVFLRSAQTALMGRDTMWSWDLERGELQGVHYDFLTSTEREVKAGLVDGYPVLIDTGTEFMDDDLVAALKKYVENGGTFIALPPTGRHTFLDPDTYPLSKLTGCQLASTAEKGPLRFAAQLPLWKGWENRSFADPGSSVGLKPSGNDVVPLASWPDGNAAITVRSLGKGRVIALGSAFWRSFADTDGVVHATAPLEDEFLDGLLSGLGVAKRCDADKDTVWTRSFITKNGLQKWLVCANTQAATTANLWWRAAEKPAQVWDEESLKPVDFEYADGWVRLKDVAFDEHGTRVFSVKNAGFAGGLPVWWAEKTRYWKCGAPVVVPPLTPPSAGAPAETVNFDSLRFKTDADGALSASPGWMGEGFDEAGWKTLKVGPWNFQDEALAKYQGVGLYRASFALPLSWKGRTVTFNLYSNDNPLAYDSAKYFLNGKLVTPYRRAGWSQTLNYDVTSLVHPGTNVLAIQVQGGPVMGGLSGCIWLQTEIPLEPVLNLKGPWDVVKGDFVTRETHDLPGAVTGKYLTRSVAIPAGWKGSSVYLNTVSAKQWLGTVLVNGHPIAYNQSVHPFGTRAQINLTPWIRFGEDNRIDLWPFITVPSIGNWEHPEGPMEMTVLELGCEKK